MALSASPCTYTYTDDEGNEMEFNNNNNVSNACTVFPAQTQKHKYSCTEKRVSMREVLRTLSFVHTHHLSEEAANRHGRVLPSVHTARVDMSDIQLD